VLEAEFSTVFARLSQWWDKYATSSVSSVKRLVGKELSLHQSRGRGGSAWHKAGASPATSASGGCSSISSVRPRRFNWS
jgi:hypothetical protein